MCWLPKQTKNRLSTLLPAEPMENHTPELMGSGRGTSARAMPHNLGAHCGRGRRSRPYETASFAGKGPGGVPNKGYGKLGRGLWLKQRVAKRPRSPQA